METRKLFDLTGRAAIVTGGAGWLGTAISEGLAEAGANVVIASRDIEKCGQLADRLSSEHAEALALPLDVNDEASIVEMVDKAADHFGRLDILVNNAYSGTGPTIDEATSEDFDRSLHMGVTSYFVAAKRARTHMLEVGEGSIVNNGSMYGVVASYPEAYVGFDVTSPPNYHATKGAVIHLTRHLAAYWAADNVRVNCVSPGPFPRENMQATMPEFIARLEAKVPMGRIGRPEEMKGVVVFLASRASSYVTGQNILVDGGWTAW